MEALVRGGRAIRYIDRGTGSPLVFVHGWSSNHSSFEAQIEHFAATHRVIAPDLRGHGRSDPAPSYRIEDFAEDLAFLAHELRLERPTLIGHSMGGMVVVEAAAAFPGAFAAVVTLDAPLLEVPELRAGMAAQIELFGGPRREEDGPAFLHTVLVGPYDDEQRAAAHIADIMTTPPEVAVAALQSIMVWPERRRLLECEQPILCVHVRGGGPTDPTAFAAGRSNVLVAQTVGSGHFIQGEVPDQVNAMIERFLRIIDRTPARMSCDR